MKERYFKTTKFLVYTKVSFIENTKNYERIFFYQTRDVI